MIRIAIYSGAPGQANGLVAALRGDGNFEVMTASPSTGGLITLLARVEADILLVEPAWGFTPLQLSEVQRRAPGARTVLWVDTLTTAMAMEAMVMGIRGILRKSLPFDLQLQCLRRVHSGDVWFEKAITGRGAEPRGTPLTPDEQTLLELLSQGLKNREIAGCLAASEGEVKVYLSRLFQKLGVKDRFELALCGLRSFRGRPGGPARASRCASEGPGGDLSDCMTMPVLPTLQ